MSITEKYDRFIDFLPWLIPGIISLLFIGWILVIFQAESEPYSFLSDYFSWRIGGLSFSQDVSMVIPIITIAYLFYFWEKYVRTQRASSVLPDFSQFIKKIQLYGLRASIIQLLLLLFVTPLDCSSGCFIPPILVLPPAVFLSVAFLSLIYSSLRYPILTDNRI
jgi:hypothetical protein